MRTWVLDWSFCVKYERDERTFCDQVLISNSISRVRVFIHPTLLSPLTGREREGGGREREGWKIRKDSV